VPSILGGESTTIPLPFCLAGLKEGSKKLLFTLRGLQEVFDGIMLGIPFPTRRYLRQIFGFGLQPPNVILDGHHAPVHDDQCDHPKAGDERNYSPARSEHVTRSENFTAFSLRGRGRDATHAATFPPLTRYNLLMPRTKNGRRIALLSGVVLVAAMAMFVWVGWARIRFFVEFESLEKNAQGYREYLHRKTGTVMVCIPGGTFTMGSPEEEAENTSTKGRFHEVTLSAFLIAKYEVDQATWKKVMGNNPSAFKGDDLPVGHVTWEQSQSFCEKTSLHLPTEAQWEYACRAGTRGPYAGTGVLDEMGWYEENSGRRAHPVGQKKPNGFGLYDMHGNAWEWCLDVFDRKFYAKSESRRKDPVCTKPAPDAHRLTRVARGGSWEWPADNSRSDSRDSDGPRSIGGIHGFRPTWSWP